MGVNELLLAPMSESVQQEFECVICQELSEDP